MARKREWLFRILSVRPVKAPLVAQEARTEVISPGVPAIEFDEPRLFGLNRILLVTDEIDKLAAVEVRSE